MTYTCNTCLISKYICGGKVRKTKYWRFSDCPDRKGRSLLVIRHTLYRIPEILTQSERSHNLMILSVSSNLNILFLHKGHVKVTTTSSNKKKIYIYVLISSYVDTCLRYEVSIFQ